MKKKKKVIHKLEKDQLTEMLKFQESILNMLKGVKENNNIVKREAAAIKKRCN